MRAESLNSQAINVESMAEWKKPYSLIRKHGILDFSWLAVRHILRKTIRLDWWTEILWERSLEGPIQEIVPRINVRIEQATEADLGRFRGMVHEDKYNRFRQRFKKGRICHVALDRERIVAYTWLSLGEYEANRQFEVKLNDKEAYTFDAYVFPEYRHSGLHSALAARKMIYCKNHDVKKIIALVNAKNTNALRMAVKDGERPSKALTIFTIFGLTFHRWQEFTDSLSAGKS